MTLVPAETIAERGKVVMGRVCSSSAIKGSREEMRTGSLVGVNPLEEGFCEL